MRKLEAGWAWTVAVAALLCGLSPAPAEAGAYYRKGTFFIGGGFNDNVGGSAQYFNSSGTFHMGFGRNVTERFTLQGEYTHNWLSIDPAVIDRAESDSVQFDNAYASMWSMTLNGVIRFRPGTDMRPWITGGFGYYKRNLQITQNALVYWPPFWDPWWGWVDGGWGPGEAISGERETSTIGYNVGAGIDFEIEGGASLYIDVRYHYAPMDGTDMQVIPVTFGVRW